MLNFTEESTGDHTWSCKKDVCGILSQPSEKLVVNDAFHSPIRRRKQKKQLGRRNI